MGIKKVLSTLIAAFISITAIPFNAVSADSESRMLVWDGTTDTSWYDSEDTEFHISTAKEFAGLAALVNSGNTMKDKTIILDNDIYMNDISNFESWSGSSSSIKRWKSIGTEKSPFSGTFDGNNYSIIGIYNYEGLGDDLIHSDTNVYYGIFGNSDGAEIKNVFCKYEYIGNDVASQSQILCKRKIVQ